MSKLVKQAANAVKILKKTSQAPLLEANKQRLGHYLTTKLQQHSYIASAMVRRQMQGNKFDPKISLRKNIAAIPGTADGITKILDGINPFVPGGDVLNEHTVYTREQLEWNVPVDITNSGGFDPGSLPAGPKYIYRAKANSYHDPKLGASIVLSEGTQNLRIEFGYTYGNNERFIMRPLEAGLLGNEETVFKNLVPIHETLDSSEDQKFDLNGRSVSLKGFGSAIEVVEMMRKRDIGDGTTVGDQIRAATADLPGGKPLIIVTHSMGGLIGDLYLYEALRSGKFSAIYVLRLGNYPTVDKMLAKSLLELGVRQISIHNKGDPLFAYRNMLFGTDGGSRGDMPIIPGDTFVNLTLPSTPSPLPVIGKHVVPHFLTSYRLAFQAGSQMRMVPVADVDLFAEIEPSQVVTLEPFATALATATQFEDELAKQITGQGMIEFFGKLIK